ncbi:low-affinity potassium transport protein [Stagonosporopsis vannaccii]|nr:low-affinity potassium transport protein [Stagonosporopsis vannaccii]
MWKPPINFITLHYAYILSFGILALLILYPYGNLSAVDAYFFGVSASTESGLNPVDVKALKTYQQVFIYIVPIVTNLGFVNGIVVVVRLRWFSKRFKDIVTKKPELLRENQKQAISRNVDTRDLESGLTGETVSPKKILPERDNTGEQLTSSELPKAPLPRISFAPSPKRDETTQKGIYIPGPRERDGQPITSLSYDDDEDAIKAERPVASSSRARDCSRSRTRSMSRTRSFSKAASMDRAVSSIFVLGRTPTHASDDKSRTSEPVSLASLSYEELGGVEYTALKMLLKVVVGYFCVLHLLGVLFLLPWIWVADPKYREYLAAQGQGNTWWAFYSSQTMISNLGFTLTPDSMISFRDAVWPMVAMSFLALAGNTCYPIFLRLLIWTMQKLASEGSSLKLSLQFLLDHPRRCYTLLFSSTATWTLGAILFALNFIDTLLIITLDLENPEVSSLPVGPRVAAALFQSVSARHTGTATFNLANVNPAIQFSLMVMMYISVYPIAMAIRYSSDYDDRSIALYADDEAVDERKGSRTYLVAHMRNQLSFDLWYVFLGVFCICATESKRIMNPEDPAFSVFSVFFEVVSAYGNVGLSLGYPTNLTSLCGHFAVFSKLVICAMMIRGRHRGLPYALDRAITLPIDHNGVVERRYRDEAEVEPAGKQQMGVAKD